MVDAKLASDIASHWNEPTAHPALQAYYANDLAAKTAVHAAKDFYIAQIGLFTSIITP